MSVARQAQIPSSGQHQRLPLYSERTSAIVSVMLVDHVLSTLPLKALVALRLTCQYL